MQGDFSRDSFDPMKNFTRVLQQQGRVQLDADWNEQVSIFWHHWRTFIKDLIGPYGGPDTNCGFGIYSNASELPNFAQLTDEQKKKLHPLKANDFIIGVGNYYVDGTLCTNREYTLFSLPGDVTAVNTDAEHLIYLDVWERHVTDIEDDSIREVALEGAGTCTRAKVQWQVRSLQIPDDNTSELKKLFAQDAKAVRDNWHKFKPLMMLNNRGRLKVHSTGQNEIEIGASRATNAGHGSGQNQLYRVEIHNGGNANTATIKWSRENGSVIFPIVSPVNGSAVTLGHLGKDKHSGLQVGDWVEVVDDDSLRKSSSGELLCVTEIYTTKLQVRLSQSPSLGTNEQKHRLLRRWDQKHDTIAGVIPIPTEDKPIPLENGIEIQFTNSKDSFYHAGDYWLIPWRAITGVEWPTDSKGPMEPHGVDHYYAPLATVKKNPSGFDKPKELRLFFEPFAFPR
jgi:hypothetical protein